MTEEEKKLLLIDLCGRLPHKVNLHIEFYDLQGDGKLTSKDIKLTPGNIAYCFDNSHWVSVKPYLRPMSSMTEEEFKKWRKLVDLRREPTKDIFDTAILSLKNIDEVTDWLNSHHFDYRGLIEMGLALEAPEGMYKTE